MNNDLISRSALLADAEKCGVMLSSSMSPSDEEIGARKVIYAIVSAPAVDAVEVVRCCKCEYSWFRLAEPYSRYCKHTGLNVGDHDFCSYGERRSE